MNTINLSHEEIQWNSTQHIFLSSPVARPVEGVVEVPGPYSLEGWSQGLFPKCPFGAPGEQIKVLSAGLAVDRTPYVLTSVEVVPAGGGHLWVMRIERMPEAVCVVVCADNGGERVIAVTRRRPPIRWGLPGGKKEKKDSCRLGAAIRELWEETGIRASIGDMWKLYEEVVPATTPDGMTFHTTTYLMNRVVDPATIPRVNEDGCQVQARAWADLTDPQQSPFAAYNVEVHGRVRGLLGEVSIPASR